MDSINRAHPSCPRCRQPYEGEAASQQSPVILPCGHAVCKQCSVEMADEGVTAQGEAGAVVPGLQCLRGCAPVAVDPHDSLPLHGELMEELLTTQYTNSVPLCEECEEAPCVSWCGICSTSLCSACFDIIHAPKVMRRHIPVPLAERPYPVETCPTHSLPLTLFCNSCTTKICTECQGEGAHAGDTHIVVSLDSASKGAVDRTRQQLHKLDVKRNRLCQTATEVQQLIAGLGPACEAAEATIHANMEGIRREVLEAIDLQEQRLVSECRSMKGTKMQMLKAQRESVTVGVSAVMSSRDFCKDVLKAHPIAVLGAQAQLASRIGGVNSACSGVESEPVVASGIPVSFAQDRASAVLHQLGIFGEVGLGACPRITASRIDPRDARPAPQALGAVPAKRVTRSGGGVHAAGSMPSLPPPALARASTAADLPHGQARLKRLRSLAGPRDLLTRRTSTPQPAAP